MSVFLQGNHLFLRSPGGEVGNPKAMLEAGFQIILCNVGDHEPDEWLEIRDHALHVGMIVAPWLRTGQDEFDPNRLTFLIDTADSWNWAPLVVNSEKEIDLTGDDITPWIAEQVGDRDAAISSEIRPYQGVDWTPLAKYVALPQRFPAEQSVKDTDEMIRENWQAAGFKCVAITYGTYQGMTPDLYPRLTPYGLYTANDCGGNFAPWSPVGDCDPCPKTSPPPEPAPPVPAPAPLTEKQAPFIEPYALAGNPSGLKSKGPTAEAVKRALAHLGFMPWNDGQFDQHWNVTVNDAAAEWKRKRGIIPESSDDGSWGEKAHSTMRSTWYSKSGDKLVAFDGKSQSLLQNEKKAKQEQGQGDKESRVRDGIVEFCEKAIAHPGGWIYTQNRPVDISVDPSKTVYSDCSGSVIQAFWYARGKTGLSVNDPAKQSWSGYGNTSYYEEDWPKVSGSYKVGDLAHYNGHVCCCIKAGDANSADWFSFGSEPPSRRKLHYRTDFRFVVRPTLLA